ncbi:MAG TPA: hypothetical protein VG297_08780 [Bryobacteraceae bacterium]|nr:hypothetical protein [Bryobacteraceae bacterium]
MPQTTVRRFFGFLSIGTILCGSALAADSQLLNFVMPDVKVLAGVNVTSARISPLGQFLILKLNLMGPGVQKFIAATGFNPLQDVTEVLAASNGDTASPTGLLMARGNFPVDKLTSLASSASGTNPPQVSAYGGATLITLNEPGGKIPHGVAFLGNTIAIVGDLASVKAAIDRNAGANSLEPALAVKVNALSSSQDEWLVSTASIASLLPANVSADAAKGPVAQVLPLIKSVQSFSGGVKFADNVIVSGEAVTTDEKNALALSAVVKLGMTLLGSISSGQTNPQLADLVATLQNAQLSTNGPALDLTLSIPEAQIENLLNSARVVKPAGVVEYRGEIRKGN